MVIWALIKDELYASTRFEMLKTLVEKIELRRNLKNLSSIEKIKAVQEALYQENKIDFLNVTRLVWYIRTQARFSHSHQFSLQTKDALQKLINAILKIYKTGFFTHKNFFKPSLQPARHGQPQH